MLSDKEARNWAMGAHLSALLGYVVPFGSIIGPLVIWLVKKDESSYVDSQGKEALNFQITMLMAAIVSIILMFVLIGFLLIFLVAVFNLIMIIIAAIKVSEGADYRYPVSLRLIK